METVIDAPPGVLLRVPLKRVTPGNNPRTNFDPAFMAWLQESIRAQGVLQKPLLRPRTDGKLEIVCGEQRIRAYAAVYGDDADMDVMVQELDDAQAAAAAATENIVREPMSPVDEAQAAARTLADCNNDRAETARYLGWPPAKLDQRLALMYAIPEVRTALQEKKIYLGHAELLATCRKEAQAKALGLLLAQEKVMAVQEFKAYLEKAALVLDSAIFEKTECAGCHHNSSNQTALFAEVISGGKCTNKACFDGKTEAELEARKVRLSEEYQLVRIARVGENLTVTPLKADGAKGVGAEQAKACRLCKDFGAVVSAVPDKLGQEFRDMCMNVTCNVRMVAAAQKPAAAPKDAKGTGSTAKGDAKAGTSGAGQAGAKPAGKTVQCATSTKAAEPSTRVKEYREKLWRKIYQVVVPKLDIVANRAVLLALCLTRPSVIDSSGLQKAMEDSLKVDVLAKPAKVLRQILTLDQKVLGQAIGQIAANVSGGYQGGLDIADVTGILEAFDVKIADHWKVGKPFFELLTRNEIDAVCDEIGVKAAMGDKYGKATKGSKEEYIDAILASGFNFVGRIPKLMTW